MREINTHKNNRVLNKIRELREKTKTSLKYKILSSFVFMILLPTLLYSIYSYVNISSTYKENLRRNLISFTEETSTNINYQFEYIKNTSLSLLVNSQIVHLLNAVPETNIDKIILQSRFEREVKPFLLFNPAWSNGVFKSIFLFKDLDNYYYTTKNDNTLQTIDDSLNIMSSMDLTGELPIIIRSPKNNDIFYILRGCYDLSTGEIQGYLLLEVDSTLIFDFQQLRDLYPNLNFIVQDLSNNTVVFSSFDEELENNTSLIDELSSINKEELYETRYGALKYFVLNNEIANSSLHLTTVIPSQDIFSVNRNPVFEYFFMFLVLTAICIKFYFTLYHGISSPLTNLLKNIKRVKNGDLKTKMPSYEYSELNDISHVFNNMTDEIDNLINQVYDKQLLIKESELKFLKSQMDPHFIFNVLDTINWHAKLSSNETISELTTNLSKLLRANLNFSGNELISVREELEYIDYYIKLQKSRFSDRLKVELSISDDSILEYKVPKLCIQPLVENAIVHGIEPKALGGLLKLQIWEDDDELYFSIVDDGVGFDVEKLKPLDEKPIDSRKKGHNSIALENIRRRLELLYADKYSIIIESKIGEGSRVRLSLPLDEGDKNV
ncbi:MAG: sensor histidine kinase [Clostridium sp.]